MLVDFGPWPAADISAFYLLTARLSDEPVYDVPSSFAPSF